eukprot:24487_1
MKMDVRKRYRLKRILNHLYPHQTSHTLKSVKNTKYDELENCIVAITGAASGIGKALCSVLHNIQKCKVIAIDVQDLTQYKDKYYETIQCDLTNLDDINKCIDTMTNKYNVEMLINCAGISIIAPFLETKFEDLKKVFAVNFDAIFLLSQGVAKYWVKNINNKKDYNKMHSIVNISSIASINVIPGRTPYCTSKFALDGLTRIMASELGIYNIKINSIHPTIVMTKLARKAWGNNLEKAEHMLNRTPMNRFVELDEVCNGVMFLLSNASNMIQGQRIVMDGGFTII